jgi:DNA-binding transcriptional regulator YhcF (GntR family)
VTTATTWIGTHTAWSSAASASVVSKMSELLRRQLTELISSGVLGPGDRLPPLRQLAADLGLAVGTVARSYRELESAGLVRSRRGGGTRVVERGTVQSPGRVAETLHRSADAFVQQARLLGFADEDIQASLDAALAGSRTGPSAR